MGGPSWVRLPAIDVPWTRLASLVLESYERDGLVAFASPWRRLVDEFADQLAGAAGKDDLGGALGEWLLDKDEVDEVFADDRALGRVVIDHARRLAKEAKEARLDADEAAGGAPVPGLGAVRGAGLSPKQAPPISPTEDDDAADDPAAAHAAAVQAWIARWQRRPFLPKTRAGDGPATASKFCGTALLRPGEAWPVCPGCQQPMRLFVQLDLSQLPAALRHPHREGMVQLFYCTSSDPLCEVDHEAWQPFGKSTLARWLSPAEVARAAAVEPTPDPAGEPAAVVVGWEQGEPEAPGYEEDVPPPPEADDPEDDELDPTLAPQRGDKLGGWPSWVQGPQYPRCPICRTRMEVLLQLDSNGLCHHQFGDLGAGHLSQCPEHPEVVAFGWACH